MLLSGIIVIGSLFYGLFYFFIIIKIFRDNIVSKALPEGEKKDLAKFSIVIAAKDEANNIERLLSALNKINYPKENYEVIIVDDNSKDETLRITEKSISMLNNFLVVKAVNKIYHGKRGALDYGISLAKHQKILITDADCTPETDWLLHHSIKISEGCKFVFGIAPFYQNDLLVNKISCYENFRNSLLSFSAAGFNIPYTASARNFSFKRDAFEKIGGYKNTTDTISGDDDLLLREAVKNNLKICTLTSVGSFVYSEAKKTFKEYFSQRARHTQSSFHYLLKQKFFLAAWHLLNIVFVLSLLLIPINIFFVIPFSTKLLGDVLTAFKYQKKFGYKFSLLEVIYLQLIYEIFLIVHFFRANFSRIEWKK
jgi:poly-beta-1,6-N-acetyl-D-glucosamine synthase